MLRKPDRFEFNIYLFNMLQIKPAELIPHGDSMCLIDHVIQYDQNSIICHTHSHRANDNPLKEGGTIHAVILNEYAAQAAAIHAGLLHSKLGNVKPAFVGAIKNFEFHQKTVNQIDAPLHIKASLELSQDTGAIYRFDITADTAKIANGKLVLVQPA